MNYQGCNLWSHDMISDKNQISYRSAFLEGGVSDPELAEWERCKYPGLKTMQVAVSFAMIISLGAANFDYSVITKTNSSKMKKANMW